MNTTQAILKTCFNLETKVPGFHDYVIISRDSQTIFLEGEKRLDFLEYTGLKNKGLALIAEPTKNDYHQNYTRTTYKVADANWGMYSCESHDTESGARKEIAEEMQGRNKGDEYDLYWRARKQVVLKITTIQEVLN